MHWRVTGSICTQGPEGYRWHKEALGAPRGVGPLRGVRGCRGIRGVLGCQGCIRGWQEV